MKTRLEQKDCIEILLEYPDKYFDVAFSDVPYGIDVANMAYLNERNTTVKQKNGNRINPNKNKKNYKLKDWDKETPNQFFYDLLCRKSKTQFIFGVNYLDWDGIKQGRIIWDKGFSDGVSFNRFEYIYCSSIDNIVELPLLWAGMMQAKNLKCPMVQQGNKKLNEKRIHPTQKPVLLYLKLFLDYIKKDSKIIDTHLGSGSSLIAADKFGITEFVGCEIDSDYFQDMRNRYNQYKSQLSFSFL